MHQDGSSFYPREKPSNLARLNQWLSVSCNNSIVLRLRVFKITLRQLLGELDWQ
jgi:hypothetical protein